MPGLPSAIEGPLREALQRCPPFSTQQSLQALFDSAQSLAPFAGNLPEGSGRNQRVALTIGYLVNRRLRSREHALVALARALAQQTDAEDELREQLERLAAEMERWAGLERRPDQRELQANPSRAAMVYVEDYEVILRQARAVARLVVMRYSDGRPEPEQSSTGTAWLVAPGLALTCFHVVDARGRNDVPRHASPADLALQVQNAELTFDLLARNRGSSWRVEALAAFSVKLDYAVLRVAAPADYGVLPLDLRPVLTQQSEVYILQHPRGLPQQLAVDRVETYDEHTGRLCYHAPTEPGTSGAPVLDRRSWRVVGLHQVEHRTTQLREGLALNALLADLEALNPPLYEEIRRSAIP